ncbi:hypothetical protein [Effusibacillus lacus]|uniref:Uncharacterized protein n=1 Tax=Effusibacillus lacus TaxID=1348429 RepID=A0A292YT95_9BACL|nr:hypothetical protein [Effusibacillus lacus]TCS74986.1 hypothetical protein EDD64_110110 [Effusibacillus lacus]GAX91654.1 hypothetical protein EFBL_3344 [Effusibacillus lacus]
MKWIEWVIAISLVVIGVSCLTMAATSMTNPDSLRSYLTTLVKICIWTAIPVLVAVTAYLIFKQKRGDS